MNNFLRGSFEAGVLREVDVKNVQRGSWQEEVMLNSGWSFYEVPPKVEAAAVQTGLYASPLDKVIAEAPDPAAVVRASMYKLEQDTALFEDNVVAIGIRAVGQVAEAA